jgi:putative transposase
VRKTCKSRLEPASAQERTLEVVLWRCRTLYNGALEQRRRWWARGHGVGATYSQQKRELPDLRAACPEYASIHAHLLQDVVVRVERTYQAFFRRVKNGETPGYPRFQGQDRYHSCTFPDYGNGVVLDGGLLSRSKIGRIPVRVHRPLEGTPKTVTISQEADGWYVSFSFSCAEVPTQPLPLTGRETGRDVGLKVFLSTAEGKVVGNPRYYRTAEREWKKAQKRVSKGKKGSTRRRKAVQLLAKKQQQVRRQRTDFHHTTALALVRQYDVLSVEARQPAHLSRRPAPVPDGNGGSLPNGASTKGGLTKSIQDAGWGRCLHLLACQAEWAGKRVEVVSPAFTTQDCSGCGERQQKSLSVRPHVCTNCGLVLDRDENAARNIQWAGQALRGVPAMVGAMNREAPSL